MFFILFFNKIIIEHKNTIIDKICEILKLYNIKLSILRDSKNILIPEYIANQYSAVYCGGGEWILTDEFELSLRDIHLLSDEYIVQAVKENEGI